MSTVTTSQTHETHPPRPYLQVFIGLAVLTLIELGVGYLESSAFVILLLLGLAIAKAALVAAVFMHVWYDKNPKLIVFGAFVVPIIAGIILLLTVYADYRS
ncbi:MAG: cytochrome C oxidase subunit IV family protein [Candidatus Kariarchaeaceae archaeon]|jgi:caa(3)-type oxidase subunit IV